MIDFRRFFARFFYFIFLSVFLVKPIQALTVSEENEISREFMAYVYQNYQMIDDPEIVTYIQRLGDKILASYPPQPFKYRFYVIKNDVYNAFACPGAQIFIHSGLFESLESEEELAGILGHEIAHSTCRHISQNIDRSGKIGLGTLAGVAAGIFLGMYGDPAAGSALTVGAIAGSQTIALAYSRDDERQADSEGLTRLYALGYTGKGLINALNKIRSRQWYGKEQIPDYLTTHPALEDRIGYIQNWIDARPELRKSTPRDDFEFKLIRTKLKAVYGKVDEGKNEFQGILNKNPDDIFALYGMGIVLSRYGKTDEAISSLKKALEKKAFHVGIIKTLGKVYFDAGRYPSARSVFEGALGVVPNDMECNLYLGRIFTESAEYERALELLKPLVNEDKGDPKVFYYLGDLYARKGQLQESYYNLGFYYKSKRDNRNALIQFERALKNAKDDETKKKIQTIINEIKMVEQKEKKVDNQENKQWHIQNQSPLSFDYSRVPVF
jgi:predicted Zn-dependent protease